MKIPCAVCGVGIECVREPLVDHEFVHGYCVGIPVMIYERFRD